MPRSLPQTTEDNLEKCRSAAIAAVEVYNRPGTRFRTAHYVILIIISWTALFHAIFYKRGKKPWYRMKSSGSGRAVRYQKIDGDPKHWDLSECIKQYYGGNNLAERKNLEFLLKLRNKIEHRHLPELDATLYGECQAALLNLEDLIVDMFGSKYALIESLAISLQFSRTSTPERVKATKRLSSSAAKSVIDYIESFRRALPSSVLNSMKYSYNVFLVPKVANRASTADAAVQFIKIDEASQDELDRLGKLNVLIKEKRIPIANIDLYRPTQVLSELQDRIPYQITMNTHVLAWKYFKVRPKYNSRNPEKTRSEYCIYDSAHGDYLYTRAWIERLVDELSDHNKFMEIAGKSPVMRV